MWAQHEASRIAYQPASVGSSQSKATALPSGEGRQPAGNWYALVAPKRHSSGLRAGRPTKNPIGSVRHVNAEKDPTGNWWCGPAWRNWGLGGLGLGKTQGPCGGEGGGPAQRPPTPACERELASACPQRPSLSGEDFPKKKKNAVYHSMSSEPSYRRMRCGQPFNR